VIGLVLVVLVLGVFPVWATLDAAMKPDLSWQAAGQSKIVWVLVCLLLGFFGSVAYVIAIRPKVVAARMT
jgi:hypothetical protein